MLNVSPTQISLLRECKRKYAFKYVSKKRMPTTEPMKFGIEGHTLMERWLRYGEYPPDTDIGLTARQGIRKDWLPTPSEDLLVEIGIFLVLRELGAQIIGLADCITPPNGMEPIVTDHKFTSSLRWAKTQAELYGDPQARIYARWAREFFEVEQAQARWIYYAGSKPKGGERPRKPAGAQKVELTFGHDDKVWDGIRADVEEIVRIRTYKQEPKSLEKNEAACDNYGGCPYRSVCMKQPGRFFPSHKEENTMGLADKMAGTNIAKRTAADGASTVNPEPSDSDLEAKLKEALAAGTNSTVVDAAEPLTEDKPKTKKKKTKKNGKADKGVLIVLQSALPNVAAPVLGDIRHLIDILAPLMREVANENGVGHWGLIEYAQGKSILAAKLDKLWAEKRPTGTILVDTSAESQAVQSVLNAYADVVIHGMR
jgi:hypothetical protein